MVPIHDTDVAEERWQKTEWEHYELWEKVEVRLRRQKLLWILATVLVFLGLSAIPTVTDHLPKWRALRASRRLAQEINAVKKEAGLEHAAFRIRFAADGSLRYTVEKLNSCAEGAGTVVRAGALVGPGALGDFVLLSGHQGSELGVPGLVREFCYDDLAGNDAIVRGQGMVGFGIVPAKDLTASPPRMDRVSVLLLSGPSAEISFD